MCFQSNFDCVLSVVHNQDICFMCSADSDTYLWFLIVLQLQLFLNCVLNFCQLLSVTYGKISVRAMYIIVHSK